MCARVLDGRNNKRRCLDTDGSHTLYVQGEIVHEPVCFKLYVCNSSLYLCMSWRRPNGGMTTPATTRSPMKFCPQESCRGASAEWTRGPIKRSITPKHAYHTSIRTPYMFGGSRLDSDAASILEMGSQVLSSCSRLQTVPDHVLSSCSRLQTMPDRPIAPVEEGVVASVDFDLETVTH